MEVSFVFHNIEGNRIPVSDDFVDMPDSLDLKNVPRIGETILIDTGLGLEEFLHLNKKDRSYFEGFLNENFESNSGQFKFTVIDVVYFTAGNYGSIYLKPKV